MHQVKAIKTKPIIFNLLHSNLRGGIEQMYLYYSEILASLEYEVICIVPSDFQYFDELNKLPVKIQIFDVHGYYDLFATYQLHRLIKRFRPLFLISHKGRSHSIVAHWQRFFAQTSRPISIGVSHGCIKRSKHFDVMICVSHYLTEWLIKDKYQGKLFCIPNFQPINPIPQVDKREGFDTFRLGVLSRLSKEKNVSLALEALRIIKNKYPDQKIHLTIAGDGDCAADLREQTNTLKLTEQVSFVGWINDKDQFFASIDALLFPSYYEPFGIIILEAFNHQIPVIAANAFGPAEIITNQHNGLLFENHNAEDLARQIQWLFNHPSAYHAIAQEGYKTLVEKYSPKTPQSLLQKVINNLQTPNN